MKRRDISSNVSSKGKSSVVTAAALSLLIVAVTIVHGQTPPYPNATSTHHEDTYQWNVGIRGVTTFPDTIYSHQPTAGRLQSATVIGTAGIGMYGLEVHDTIDIPFYVATASSSHRIDYSYKITGLLHTLKLSTVGSAKGFYDIWVDTSIVDSAGNAVSGHIGTWDQLYRTDLSWAAYAGEAASIALSGAIDAYGPGWASKVLEIVDMLDNVIPENVFNTTYSKYVTAPLAAGQWYKLRIQLGSKTGSAALGLAGCFAISRLDLQVLSIATPGAPTAPSLISYPTSSASGSYSVSWPSSAGATSYRVERSSNGGSTWTLAYPEWPSTGTDTSFAESRGNGAYRYRVRASNSAGDSGWYTGTHNCIVNIESAGTQVTARYDPVADAYISIGGPDGNYGSGSFLHVSHAYNGGVVEAGLIRFGDMGLPSHVTLSSARLRLNAKKVLDTAPTIIARYLAGNWTENGVTWDNCPGTVQPPSPISKSFPSLGSSYSWIDIDVMSFVRGWVDNPNSNLGIFLAAGVAETSVMIMSRNYPTSSSRPYLEVTFSETIASPTSLSGPTSGQTDESLSYTASGASSSLGHSLQYQYEWGDGSESTWGSASRSKTYSTPGTYGIKVRARCQSHTAARSEWSGVLKTVVVTQTHTVNTPNTPSGPVSGYVGTSYEFSTSGGSCSQGHHVEYQFDWGDTTQSGWGGPSAFKSFGTANTYNVKARTRCAVNTSVFSDWTGIKSVTISPIPTYSLNVTAIGASSVVITSSTGHGGTTPYSHSILQNTAVALEAPEYVGTGVSRKRFSEWTGAVTSTQRAISFDMDSAKALTANYVDAPNNNNPPNPPTLINPANGATGASLTPTLQASAFFDPDPGDTHSNTRWQVIDGNTGELAWDSGIGTAATSVQIPSGHLEYSTEYFWAVWYYDSQDETYGSMTPSSFTTMADPGAVVATPTFNPDGGSNPGSSVNVTITCATDGATIRYTSGSGTTPGADPTTTSTVVPVNGIVNIPVPGWLKAKAWKDGMPESGVKSATYSRTTYTISYSANGATSGTAPASQTKTHGVALTLATNSGNLAKTGYTFAGWNTAANGSGTTYVAGANYTANASVTLYAKWTVEVVWNDGYTDIGGGWRRLSWFGDYIPMGGDGWIWHNKHGFFYVAASATPENIWLFTQDMGWLWTRSSVYPFLFRHNDRSWLWYNGSTNPRWFVNMATGQWERHD